MVTLEYLKQFAKASGDYNPIHIDPNYAKRSIFGNNIVYGIYQVFLILENFLKDQPAIKIHHIQAQFISPLFADEPFTLSYQGTQKIQATLSTNHLVTQIAFDFIKQSDISKSHSQDSKEKIYHSSKNTLGGGGEIKLAFNKINFSSLFPLCSKKLCDLDIAILLASTQLVGMHCPGLNSIYASFCFELPTHLDKLTYTSKTHQTIPCTIINLLSVGQIKALKRPEPIKNLSLEELNQHYPELKQNLPFKHQKALVIGGSQGIGYACANLLFLGGADVLPSFYHTNPQTTQLPYFYFDISHPSEKSLQTILDFNPTHLYFFATPKIKPNKDKFLDSNQFLEYLEYYVFGLNKILKLNLKSLTTIYAPSTIFIEESRPDFKEYILSKMILEYFCHFFNNQYRFILPRLPKTQTNQTLEIYSQKLPRSDEVVMKSFAQSGLLK